MAIELIRCDKDKDNSEVLFRLVNKQDNVNVFFTYKNFREVLGSIGLSSKRIGCIVLLLNRLCPIDIKKYRVTFEESFNDQKLIEFLQFHGFMVKKIDDRLDVVTAIKNLESRGYEVKGFLKSVLYQNPIPGYNQN